MPEEQTYRLSELYQDCSDNPELELTVKVLNINQGMNTSLMHSCKKLNEYSMYVAKVREFSESESLNKAVPKAVDYCIEHDILKEFLLRERKAVIMYSLYEYDKAGHMKVIARDAKRDSAIKLIRFCLKNGISDKSIRENLKEDYGYDDNYIDELFEKAANPDL